MVDRPLRPAHLIDPARVRAQDRDPMAPTNPTPTLARHAISLAIALVLLLLAAPGALAAPAGDQYTETAPHGGGEVTPSKPGSGGNGGEPTAPSTAPSPSPAGASAPASANAPSSTTAPTGSTTAPTDQGAGDTGAGSKRGDREGGPQARSEGERSQERKPAAPIGGTEVRAETGYGGLGDAFPLLLAGSLIVALGARLRGGRSEGRR